MALDEFQMPQFENPDGTKLVWDSASKSYVRMPATDNRPDQSHATGGDNDLFDPFQHTETGGNPTMEGYMARAASFPEGTQFPPCKYCGKMEGFEVYPFARGMLTCKGCGTTQPTTEVAEALNNMKLHHDMDLATLPETDHPLGPTTGSHQDDPPFAGNGEVKCPNCGEVGTEQSCPHCHKDLTPEWNVAGQQNEFMDAKPNFNDASEFWTWPQNVPKKNEQNYDDSFPSMSLSKTAGLPEFHEESGQLLEDYGALARDIARTLPEEEWPQWVFNQLRLQSVGQDAPIHLPKVANEGWDDMFADPSEGAGPAMRTEVGKWIMDARGQLHYDHGMAADHDTIIARDEIGPNDMVALGSVYNDGTADTQQVFHPEYLNLEQIQAEITRVFGPVQLAPPVGMGATTEKGHVFQPFDITGGTWFIPTGQPITGIAWVKERANGVEYQPNMILCAEHLRPEDLALWSRGVAAIVTATGGASSHATYLAMTENVPVVTGIGDAYNKVETGNYLKIDPANETIAVMPGATNEWQPEQKQQVWNNILEYQRQRGGSVSKPEFSHIIEEEQWHLANSPNLSDCPECRAPMTDQDSESVCHDCGHKQPIIHSAGAAALALPEVAELAGGAGGAGAAAGGGAGGIGGMGGLMQKAMNGAAFRSGENSIGGGQDAGQPVGGAPAAGGTPLDPNAGVVSRRFAKWDMQHTAVLSEIFTAIMNAIKSGAENPLSALGQIATNPLSPVSYVDDALAGGVGVAQQQLQNAQRQAALGDEDEDNVGLATKNDGTNSTDEASTSGIEGKKEQGDGPEQLKDVDGGHDSQGSHEDGLMIEEIDPHVQDKALKAFHMNLPLVLEFANSDEPGADNPILQALDAMLEEAFPGYKDGHDPAGATTEHPQEETGQPDEKSEGADKKEASAEPEACKACKGDTDDPVNKGFRCDRCGGTGDEPEEPYEAMRAKAKEASVWHYAWDPDEGHMSPGGGGDFYPQMPERAGQYVCPNCEMADDTYGQGTGRCQNCGEKLVDVDGPDHAPDDDQGYGDYDMYGPDRPTMQEHFPHEGGMNSIPGMNATPENIPGVPAGAGGLAMEICPRCGQAHTPGTPCPVADVTTPLTTGDPMAQGMPATHVVTKWHLAMPSSVPALAPQQQAGAPAAPATCPMCGCNHMPGTPCPSYDNQQQMQQPGATGQPMQPQQNTVAPQVGPGVAYSHEEHTEHAHDDSDSDDWTDESGMPLQEGIDYEMKTAHSPIPDRVTIEHILPERLTYVIHSGDVDFRDTISRDQLDLDGTSFAPVDFDNTGEDSMDRFPGEEMPPRPGDDALPQQDDVSTPSTVVSFTEGFEPVSLDTYTGSFSGDETDNRNWLLEDSSPVEVDPGLMAKMAGKNFNPREQREFIDEKGEARNLDRLDLDGTHYIEPGLGIEDSLW